MSDRELLREREVFEQFGLTRPWLRKGRAQGFGPPFVRIGRMIIYRRVDIEAYLLAHRIEPRSTEEQPAAVPAAGAAD